jgi:hypothetical protein
MALRTKHVPTALSARHGAPIETRPNGSERSAWRLALGFGALSRRRYTHRRGLAEPRAAAGSLDDGEAKVFRAGVRECKRGANTPCPRVRRSRRSAVCTIHNDQINRYGETPMPDPASGWTSELMHCLNFCLNCTQLHTTHVYMCTTRPGARCAPMSHGDRTLRSLRRCRSLEVSTRSRREGDRGRSLVRYLLGMPPRSPPLDADHTSHAP